MLHYLLDLPEYDPSIATETTGDYKDVAGLIASIFEFELTRRFDRDGTTPLEYTLDLCRRPEELFMFVFTGEWQQDNTTREETLWLLLVEEADGTFALVPDDQDISKKHEYYALDDEQARLLHELEADIITTTATSN